jgi:hypothetical protein
MADRHDSLDDFWTAMRGDAPLPTGDLLARIEAQALAERPVPGARVAAQPWWRGLLAAVGGWPGAVGLATACALGVWLGIDPPAALDGVWTGETAALDMLGVDPLSGYDLAWLEG